MMRDMQETIDFLHKENKELALEIIKLRDEKRELENRENLYEKKISTFFSLLNPHLIMLKKKVL